jgi:hypothetical protein
VVGLEGARVAWTTAFCLVFTVNGERTRHGQIVGAWAWDLLYGCGKLQYIGLYITNFIGLSLSFS